MFYPLLFLLLLTSHTAMAEESVDLLASPQSSEAPQQLSNLRVVLSKLGETLKTNRDLDSLKELGMPEREVKRLKQALDMKVKQLTDDALYVIRSI